MTLPKIGTGKAFRRIIHYEDQYTVKPLEVTNLAGRDPVTGKVAFYFYYESLVKYVNISDSVYM